MKTSEVVVDVSADTTEFDYAMQSLNDATKDFGSVFSSTISRAITSGKSLDDTIRSIGQRFADLALNSALKPLEGVFDNLLGSVFSGIGAAGIPGFADGGVVSNGSVVPFARGGVVSSPTPFNFGKRLGVMGEAGPEAIIPLARGPDGKLGVSAGQAQSGSMNVVFNVNATDASSFKRSEGQITAMLARAVARGQRSL